MGGNPTRQLVKFTRGKYVEGPVHQGGDARVNGDVVADLKCVEELFHSVIRKDHDSPVEGLAAALNSFTTGH